MTWRVPNFFWAVGSFFCSFFSKKEEDWTNEEKERKLNRIKKRKMGTEVGREDQGLGSKEQEDIRDSFEEEEVPQPVNLREKLLVIVVGLLVGTLMCFSNMYFGLQTGFISMMSIQSATLGFGAFRLIKKWNDVTFTIHDNVLLQTVSVATATMPLAAGFVGIIPALAIITKEDTDAWKNPDQAPLSVWWTQILWCLAVAFIGVFVAVPLRKQVILREKLTFPSGTATAKVLQVLHDEHVEEEIKVREEMYKSWEWIDEDTEIGSIQGGERNEVGELVDKVKEGEEDPKKAREQVIAERNMKWKLLFITFSISSFYALVCYFFPFMYHIPVFNWVHLSLMTEWQWTLTPSFSYIGQGMIMGIRSALSMFAGSLVAWAILGPIVQVEGWCDGVMDSEDGCSSWLLWVSLAIMLGESLVSLSILTCSTLYVRYKFARAEGTDDDGEINIEKIEEELDPAPPSQQVPRWMWISGFFASCALCIAVVVPLFDMKWYEPVVALALSVLTAVLAVRALGETDLNPVSGIGKISQIIFGFVAPGDLVANLIAGGIAEAAAQQSGDLMQDLKTGHLLRASPRAQFFGQLLGSFYSIFVSIAAFALYSNAYGVPSEEFPVPTAFIWVDMAQLVNGGQLAENVLWFCVAGGILAGCLPVIGFFYPSWRPWLPSGVAFAIGMYITPNWTVARMIGSAIQFYWSIKNKESHDKYMIITASGFVLGEGVTSILSAGMASAGVPHYPFSGS